MLRVGSNEFDQTPDTLFLQKRNICVYAENKDIKQNCEGAARRVAGSSVLRDSRDFAVRLCFVAGFSHHIPAALFAHGI